MHVWCDHFKTYVFMILYVPISATNTWICSRWPNNIKTYSQKDSQNSEFPLGQVESHQHIIMEMPSPDSPPNTKLHTRFYVHRHLRISLTSTSRGLWHLSINCRCARCPSWPCWSSGSMKPKPLCENQRRPQGLHQWRGWLM